MLLGIPIFERTCLLAEKHEDPIYTENYIRNSGLRLLEIVTYSSTNLFCEDCFSNLQVASIKRGSALDSTDLDYMVLTGDNGLCSINKFKTKPTIYVVI